jgi:hypothetical protein
MRRLRRLSHPLDGGLSWKGNGPRICPGEKNTEGPMIRCAISAARMTSKTLQGTATGSRPNGSTSSFPITIHISTKPITQHKAIVSITPRCAPEPSADPPCAPAWPGSRPSRPPGTSPGPRAWHRRSGRLLVFWNAGMLGCWNVERAEC